ncbi:MAG: efflux RND transporter periplasmic adaptor subunit, partial [Treponema sp.]|nr:efflux RND transporter periplasmic adaptor subunit [Treponema sp.]
VNVISIAQDAIVTVNDSSYLYVVKEDSTVEKRLITLGKNVNGYYQITSGIEPNEKVVVAGMLTLTDGAKVKDITETAN